MLKKLEQSLNKLMDWVGIVSALLLILLVLVIGFNVLNRYALQIDGLGVGYEELAWHFYSACFLLAIPFALRTGSHVRVDLIYENLKPKTKAIIDMVGTLIFLVPFCFVVVWSGWTYVLEAWSLGDRPDNLAGLISQIITTGVGEKSQDPGGLLNRWIIKSVIPLAFFLLFLASISFFINKLNIFLGVVSEDDSEAKNEEEAQA